MFSLIDTLTAFILTHNPYFKQGFANVSIDEKLGIVGDENKPIFPSSSFGDYFYVRYAAPVALSNLASGFMEEGRMAASYQIPLVLVAVVRDADSDILFTNLLTTLANYKDKGLQAVRFERTSEEVIEIVTTELAGLKPADLDAALQRLDTSQTLVSIRFTLVSDIEIQSLSCIQNPCKPCS